ncbi:MAG TPA: terminase family protein, partial [Gemmataceae bacterium]|nr:terminase family protein [Gemmataceae bacterium]
MDPARSLALALDPALILQAQGLNPDPWQRQFLLGADRQVLLNCCRQSGKSTATAARALHAALFAPRSLVLLLSPTQRQSAELFRKVRDAYDALGRPVPAVADARSQSRLELANGSRVVGLPGKEGTIRGFSRAALLLIDEAAKVHDDLYRSVRPMLAVSRGRLVCLSTPFGQRGFFLGVTARPLRCQGEEGLTGDEVTVRIEALHFP